MSATLISGSCRSERPALTHWAIVSSRPELLPKTMSESVETFWFVLVFMALVTTKDSEDRSSELAPPLNNSRTSPGQHRRADSVSRVQVSQSGRNESGRAIYLSPSCVGEGKMTPFLTAGGSSCSTNGRVGPSP